MSRKQMTKAKKGKKDEFYTKLADIEKELRHYRKHFKNKVVFCNCDDPRESNFTFYFAQNFSRLGLKKLICTHFKSDGVAYKLELNGDINQDGRINIDDLTPTKLKQNGDFRSDECIELLKEADIVVTNPPFSLFREYIAQLFKYDKKFLLIGNNNAITYKEIWELLKSGRMWLGTQSNTTMEFEVPKEYEAKKEENGKKFVKVPAISWFTNLDHKKRNEELILYKKYDPNEYHNYDNYNAINVDKVNDIPIDYNGIMGVPITFLGKHNPNQFEIVRFRKGDDGKDLTIKGKHPYLRILIKKK